MIKNIPMHSEWNNDYRKNSELSTKKRPKSGGRVAIGVTVSDLGRGSLCYNFDTICVVLL